jgi:hypothetical protein
MTRIMTIVVAVLGGSALSLANLSGGSADGSCCKRENCPPECCSQCPCERCEYCRCDGAQAVSTVKPMVDSSACCPAGCCDAVQAAK